MEQVYLLLRVHDCEAHKDENELCCHNGNFAALQSVEYRLENFADVWIHKLRHPQEERGEKWTHKQTRGI